MRVRFGNKIYESDQIIYPGGLGRELYVSYSKGSYRVICPSEESAKQLFECAFKEGFVDFNEEEIEYDNMWDTPLKI